MQQEFSAGGCVYKIHQDTENNVFWLICKHSGYHKWVLPKGIIEPGETKEQAALREVKEECGIKSVIMRELEHPETYSYELHGEKIQKTVTYFLMNYVSGDIKNHNWEMEDVRWVRFDEAMQLLEYPGAKHVLEEAQKLIQNNQ